MGSINFADLLQNQSGRLAEARHVAEEALAIKQTFDPGATLIWKTYDILAEIADKENDPAQVREYRRQARAAYRNFPGNQLQKYTRLIEAVSASILSGI